MLSTLTIQLLLLEATRTAGQDRRSMLGAKYYDGKKIVLPISKEGSRDLLNHWLHQAASGIMSAFATSRMKKGTGVNEHHQYRFHKCSKKADTVHKQARCVMNLLTAERNEQQTDENTRTVPYDSLRALLQPDFMQMPVTPGAGNEQITEMTDSSAEQQQIRAVSKPPSRLALRQTSARFHKYRPKSTKNQKKTYLGPSVWIGGFGVSQKRRTKRRINVVSRDRYSLLTKSNSRSAWGHAARVMKNVIRKIKGKKELKSWYVTLAEIEQLGKALKKKESRKKQIKESLKALAAAQNRKASVEELRELAGPVQLDIKDFNGIPMAIEEQLEEQVMAEKKRFLAGPMKLLRDSVKLGMMLANKNVSGFERKIIRFASPKFFAIAPEEQKDEEIRLLSPSLFNLHGEGQGIEKIFSIPSFIRAIKTIKEGDHEDLLDFIFEAAGVTDAIETAKEKLKWRGETVNSARGIDGQPLYFSKANVTEMYGDSEKHKIDTFERVYKSLTQQQRADLNETGYSALNTSQLQTIYGYKSPYYDPAVLSRLIAITDKQQLQELLVQDINKIGNATEFGIIQNSSRSRPKRAIVLSPLVLSPVILAPATASQPIILSPLLLSPVILSPAIFGPFILSPWLFIPLILAPRILSPFVINPFALSPIVLSPVALHPFILSPGILNPIVLNPLLLSPLILSPQALTPITLTPLLLSPLVLNPMAFSPLVLSPFALSPLVLSPQFVFALVLSPYFLSPLIASNLTYSAIIMSPSFLSS